MFAKRHPVIAMHGLVFGLALVLGHLAGCSVKDSSSLLPSQTDTATNPKVAALRAFIDKKKFVPEPLYPGATNEATRAHCQAVIDALADRLLPLAGTSIDQQRFVAELKRTIAEFGPADSEEVERGARYVEELMNILGIESSGGLLNQWAYGFNPPQRPASSNGPAAH